MSQVDPTIITVSAQVMQAAALAITMSLAFTVATVANTVTGSYLVTFFSAPIAVPLNGLGTMFLNGLLGVLDLSATEARIGSCEVAGNATIEAGMGIGICKAA